MTGNGCIEGHKKKRKEEKERSACYGIKSNQCETEIKANNTVPNALEITFS